MQIEKSFVVAASPDRVWALLTDPHRVAQCLPGAAITGQVDDQTWEGTITVKVGPVTTNYRGKVRFEQLDADARTAEVVASGQEVRGKGGADLKMTSRLVERGPRETEVNVVQEIAVTGILAQMGRGMIQTVGDELFGKFTAAVHAQLEAEGAADAGRDEAETPDTAGGAPGDAAGGPGASAAEAPGPTVPARPAPQPAEPIQVLSLGASVLGRSLGRAARNPWTWVAAAGLAVIAWWLSGR